MRPDRYTSALSPREKFGGIMKKKISMAILALLLACSFCFAGGARDESATAPAAEKAGTITLTDNVGREVELPYPVTRAVTALRYNSELIRACGAIEYIVAADLNTAQDRTYWSNFDPENVIGKSQRELNYEKIIELDPQVVILPSNGAYEEAEEKLSPFGIKVFVISGYDTGDFENQVANIGKMFDKEKEAARFYDFYMEPIREIEKKLEGIEKRTVYFETTRDFSTTFPGGYYFVMLQKSGSLNIFENPSSELNSKEIDPEAVILANPEFIVKNVTPDKARSGTGVYDPPLKEQMDSVIQGIRNRPGWDEISAVQNDHIYLMSQFGHGAASKILGSIYIAKWVYPDILTDLDPDVYFKAWLEDFQGFGFMDGHFYPLP